jgi:hypothetical protein
MWIRRASSWPANHLRADTGLALDACQELAAVGRLARGARGRGQDGVHFVRLGDALEGGERAQGAGRGVGGEGSAVEPAGAEPDHRLLAVDDLEGEVLAHAHDDHVNGVGTDVDGRQPHDVI